MQIINMQKHAGKGWVNHSPSEKHCKRIWDCVFIAPALLCVAI